jgi:hypothetical protein
VPKTLVSQKDRQSGPSGHASPKQRIVGHLWHGRKHLPIHATSLGPARLRRPWARAQSRKPMCSRDLSCRSVGVHSDLRV